MPTTSLQSLFQDSKQLYLIGFFVKEVDVLAKYRLNGLHTSSINESLAEDSELYRAKQGYASIPEDPKALSAERMICSR
jgi:hypothetical protein